ncbi:MAG: hypothetical protein QOD39_5263 [Mycobacterium sp.]|jgi:hypothetical protein|nr:hypothetical protein [Mycobacterium sp.]
MLVWSRASETFGVSTPQGGDRWDQSAQLRQLQRGVQSAAPRSEWTGAGSDTFVQANGRHGRTIGAIADLDMRLGGEVDRSAAVVTAGRRDLDAVKQWVADAASTVPRTAAGDRMLWPVVSKGSREIADVIRRSDTDLSTIAERMRGLGAEYQEAGRPRRDADVELVNFDGDGEDSKSDVPDTTLDLNDIEYLGPGSKGRAWQIELVPVDLAEIEIVDPKALIPADRIELWPRSGIIIPNPHLGRPF